MDKIYYQILKILLIISFLGTLLLCIIMPVLLIGVIIEIILIYITSKKINKIKSEEMQEKEKEQQLLSEGYNKIYK